MFAAFALAAVCLMPPVDGHVTADYRPVGRYAGHWGVDYAAVVGDVVRAPVSGRVTFAGSVAGMRSVTIEPVPGVKVSLSYLDAIVVREGAVVARGSPVGRAGSPHGRPGVHLSVRIGGRYVDPISQMGCVRTDISRALRLVTPPQPYPRSRANRNSGWNLRPHPHCPSPYRRDGPSSARAGPRPGDACGRPLAEVFAQRHSRRAPLGDVSARR